MASVNTSVKPGTAPCESTALTGRAGLQIIDSNDLDHYLSLQPGGWDMQITQLAPAAFSSRLRIIEFEGLVVYQNFWGPASIVQGQSPEGWLMMGGIVNPDEAPVSWCGARKDRRHFGCTAGGQEVDFCVADNSSDIVVLVDPSLMKRAFGDDVADALVRSKHLDFGDAGGELIDLALSMLNKCQSDPQLLQRPAVVAQACSDVLRVLEECFSNDDSQHGADNPNSRHWLVHCAMQHVRQTDGQTSAWGMAQAVGVSQKTLELAFRDVLRTTPGKYLLLTRLNRAHRALASADQASTSVTDIAMSLGFSHMGRFASAYRNLFGELPSQTLER